jgi:hypothetical protein
VVSVRLPSRYLEIRKHNALETDHPTLKVGKISRIFLVVGERFVSRDRPVRKHNALETDDPLEKWATIPDLPCGERNVIVEVYPGSKPLHLEN